MTSVHGGTSVKRHGITNGRAPGWRLVLPLVLLVGCTGSGERADSSSGTGGSGATSAGGGGVMTGGSGAVTTAGLGGLGGIPEAGMGGMSGAPGSSGTASTAGFGGIAGAAGAATTSGAGSGGSSAGTAGTGPCSFEIEETLSPAIPTVGIVNWSTRLVALTGATIEFTLDDPASDELNRGSGGPIDITGQTHRALLLGLKPERTYTYRIIARSGDTLCTSPDRSLTTGGPKLPLFTLDVTRPAGSATTPSRGFIVTSNYSSTAYILDTDGDIVWWWTTGPGSMSRARMDWGGDTMWMIQVFGNPGGQGEVGRVSMDGTESERHVAGLDQAHHDLAVLPGGIIATLRWTEQTTQASDLVERSPDGTITTVARLDDRVFLSRTRYHANAIAYHAVDDTFTVSDLEAGGFVKLSRAGAPLWQFLAGCPSTPVTKCAAGDTVGNHGHHLLENGNFLFMKARLIPSIVREYQLTESANALMAREVWSYTPETNVGTSVLGDVQRLPNGNTLVTYSSPGLMREISPTGDVVQTFETDRSFGYADFRETLYGPPPR